MKIENKTAVEMSRAWYKRNYGFSTRWGASPPYIQAQVDIHHHLASALHQNFFYPMLEHRQEMAERRRRACEDEEDYAISGGGRRRKKIIVFWGRHRCGTR